jgi:hypothetical protein
MSELKTNRIEDFLDVTKCDLAHHAAQLQADFEDPTQKEIAGRIGEQSDTLLSLVRAGELVPAEEGRKTLLASCRQLKDLL